MARLLAERGHEVRVTYRDERRPERLPAVELQPLKAGAPTRRSTRRGHRHVQRLGSSG